MANILQSNLLTDFLYPFLLMFFIVFAVLEKAKIFGDGKQQLNAFVSLVVGLIFVSAAGYVGFASEMILFMTIGIIVIFVGLMFWGLISGEGFKFGDGNKKLKLFFGVAVLVSIVIAVFVSIGVESEVWNFIEKVYDLVFHSGGSSSFWTNFITIVVVVGAVGAILKSGAGGGN